MKKNHNRIIIYNKECHYNVKNLMKKIYLKKVYKKKK